MKRLRRMTGVIGMVGLGVASAMAAGGYPDFYLRGSDIPSDEVWGLNENYKFSQDGDVYSLHLENLTGQFKISNADWTINYGAASADVCTISISAYVTGVNNGRNWNCTDLHDIDISFTYDESAEATVKFVIGGVEPAEPEPPYMSQLSGTLPVIYINVYKDETHQVFDNEVISKDLDHKNYFKNAEYWLDLNGCKWAEEMGATSVGSKEEPLPLEIKARGNWTRLGFAKKPFKLKLGSKANLMNLTPKKSKHYAILAHADDNYSYLKNFVGFNLGKKIGLPWTPGMQPIEVVMNGDYRGIYFLTESIRIGDGRIDITELKDNVSDPALISGGYLVELDNYDEENQIRFEEKPYANGDPTVRVTFDTPEVYSALQYQFISEQFNKMNDLVGEYSNDLWSYIDLDDAARYYIVEEIISHVESYHGSTYLFRDYGEGQKWHFSPLWDCGNAFNGPTNDYFYKHAPYGCTWIHSFVRNDRFKDKVRQTWRWFMANKYGNLTDEIEEYCGIISEAAKADHRRWKDAPLPNYLGSTNVANNSDIERGKRVVLNHLRDKIEWLKGEFGEYDNGIYDEPSRDNTPAAPLPEYITSGVELNAVSESEGNAAYYNLEGIRISKPEGGIYIKVSNGKAEKVIE